LIEPPKQYTVSDVEAAERMLLMEHALADAGTPFRRIEGDRTVARQVWLYMQGRTIPGPRVDAEHPMGLTVTDRDGVTALSNHQHGRAADYWPVDGAGHAFCPDGDDPIWETLAEAAEAQGLASGLRWKRRDADHVEWVPS
jgi:hypothetical protein